MSGPSCTVGRCLRQSRLLVPPENCPLVATPDDRLALEPAYRWLTLIVSVSAAKKPAFFRVAVLEENVALAG